MENENKKINENIERAERVRKQGFPIAFGKNLEVLRDIKRRMFLSDLVASKPSKWANPSVAMETLAEAAGIAAKSIRGLHSVVGFDGADKTTLTLVKENGEIETVEGHLKDFSFAPDNILERKDVFK